MPEKLNPTRRLLPLRTVMLFTLISVLGWLWEMAVEWLAGGRLIFRGFLTGPYLPIYGFGMILIAAIVQRRDKSSPWQIFLLSTLTISLMEWVTGLCMESIFQRRWWDYSRYPLNINGRVCLYSALLLGLGGTIGTSWLLPRLSALLDRLSPLAENYLALICGFIISLDFIHSLSLMLP